MMTTENLFFLSLQVFSSGIAGYITNKYAVNMIFKEYTPLKIGGAVKKNKEKFIEEISDLVERDIINSSTIKDNISSEKFRNVIKDASDDFLTKSLYEAFDGIKIEDVLGIEETIENSKELFEEDIVIKLLKNVSEHLNVEDILSEEQILHIVDYIYDEINNVINEDENIKNLVFGLYKEQSDVCLNQVVSKETSDKITKIISCEIVNSIDEILEDKKDTKQLVDKVLSLLDIKLVMKDLQKSFGSKTIEDILTDDGINKLSLAIYIKLDELIKSSQGNEKIDDFIDKSIASMEDIDLTIFEILPIHFGRTSSEYIVEVLRNIAPYFITWIENNKLKIEKIIDDSIVESIDNIDDELRKSMISKVKDTMLVDFASNNQIVEKINEFITSYINDDEVSTKVYEKLIKFLEETKISDIVKILKDNNLLNKEEIKAIIVDKWEVCGEQISKDLIKKQCTKTLNGVMGQDFYRLFNKVIKPNLYEVLNNNKGRIISYLDKAIFNLVHTKIDNILDQKISDLVNEEKVSYFSKKLPQNLSKYVNLNSTIYKKKLKQSVENLVKGVNLNNIIKNNEETIINTSKTKINNIIKSTFEKYRSYEVKEIIGKINNKDKFTDYISDKTYEGVVDHLPKIVDGNVKKVIYDNLIKLDEEEICDIAQSFMGKQLKPLSIFGAFLGCIVGLIFGLVLQNVNGNYGFYNNIQNTLIACLILGGVGVMTNVIALWMIFCPYEKNKFIARIPILKIFSIGYIPAHKESFANGMAYFIDNELLSGTRLSNLFKSKKENLKNSIIENLNNNDKSFSKFINSKKESLCKLLYKFILKITKENKISIVNYLNKNIMQLEGKSIVSHNFIKSKFIGYASNLNKYDDKIIDYLEEKLKTNKSIEELFSQDLVKIIDNKINNDIKVLVNKSIEKDFIENAIENYILNNNKMYDEFINKSLDDVISDKIFVSLEKNLKSDKSINLLLLQLKSILSNLINDYIENKLGDDKRLDEILDGEIKNKINGEIYNLTEKSIDMVSTYAIKNQDMVSDLVVKVVRGNLNFFVKMAYDFADGDGLVRDVIEIAVSKKLKPLLIEEKDNLSVIIYNTLDREVYKTKITDLGITFKEININLVLDRYVYGLKQNEDFSKTTNKICDLVIETIKNVKVKEITDIFEIETVDLVYNKCEIFFKSLSQNITQNLKDNQDEVNEFIYQIVNNKMMRKLYEISLVEMSWEISRKDVSYSVEQVLSILSESNVLHDSTLNIIDNVYYSYIENLNMNEVLNQDVLFIDIDKCLNSLLEDKDFNEKNKKQVIYILNELIQNEFKFIDKELKIFIRDKFIDATLDTGERYITPLLTSINLKDITIKEVENMHPKEIHALFKSFAGDFFKKLYLYGGLGFIFGINLYLSIILLVIDMIYTKQIEKRVINTTTNKLFKDS